MTDADLEHFIRDRLPVAPAPGIPEIRLHLAGPGSGLGRLGLAEPPYWARCWGGGLALARHILSDPAIVGGRRVLDLGCGGGLVAIAAALAGARTVTATDVDTRALVAVRRNAALNEVVIETGPTSDEVDLVLAGDVFYDPEAARRSTEALDRWAAAGVPALVGDPWRRTLPTERLRKVADYRVLDFGAPAPAPAAVFDWV